MHTIRVLAAESQNYSIEGETVGSQVSQVSDNSSSQSYLLEGQSIGNTISQSESANFTIEKTIAPLAVVESNNTLAPTMPSESAMKISAIQAKELTDRSAVITWITRDPSTSVVWYDSNIEHLSNKASDASSVITHRIYLKNLQPQTKYFFKVTGKTESGETSQSDIQSFKTLPDTFPPSNAVSFRADSGDSIIVLRWENPKDIDFAGVMIRRSKEFYPIKPADGDLLLNGLADFFTDTDVINGTLYYYTIFSFDLLQNFSSGALANNTPKTTPIPNVAIPPAEIAAPEISKKPEVFPEIKEKGEQPVFAPSAELSLDDFEVIVFTESGPIKLRIADIKENARIVKESQLALTLNKEKLSRPVKVIIVSVGSSVYLFQFDPVSNKYEASFYAPNIKGTVDLAIFVVYEDGTKQQLNTNMNIDPKGYVFREVNGEELRLKKSLITLYWLNPTSNQFETWPAPLYNQKNPIITDESGEYFFLVPPGNYYLEAQYNNQKQKTDAFEVKDVIINKNIKWTKTPPKFFEPSFLEYFLNLKNIENALKPYILLISAEALIVVLLLLIRVLRKK